MRQTVAGACTARAWRCSTSSSPRTSCGARTNGCSGPATDYELSGDVPGVVFPCGLVHQREADKLFLYYGAADTRVGLATASCSEVLDYLLGCPPG